MKLSEFQADDTPERLSEDSSAHLGRAKFAVHEYDRDTSASSNPSFQAVYFISIWNP